MLERLARAKTVSAEEIDAATGLDPDDFTEQARGEGVIEEIGVRVDGNGMLGTVFRRVR